MSAQASGRSARRMAVSAATLAVGVMLAAPADPGWARSSPFDLTIDVGFSSRDVTVQEEGPAPGTLVEESTVADSSRVLLTLAVTPVEPVTLYVIGGGASVDLDEFGYNGTLDGAYGGGLTLTLYRSDSYGSGMSGFSLFLDGRYLRFVTDDRVVVTVGGVPTTVTEEIAWSEARARLGVRGRYFGVETYGGLGLSWVRGDDRFGPPVSDTFDLEEEDQIGLFGGLLVPLDPRGRLAFFLEFNIIDEDAVRAGLTFSL